MINNNGKNLKIVALGGLYEVGKNCTAFFVTDESTKKIIEMIIVDCGIKFLNNGNYNLANGIIPNFSFLKENKDKIKGLFITHGHEDHIGGIPYLLDEVGMNFPIYGSAFSLALLKQKLGKKENQVRTIIFKEETVVSTSEFIINFFSVTHSIPGSFGLIIKTERSRIVVTGDFKFDWTTIGEKTNLFKLAEAGKKGVDLLLSDSTNAEKPGVTPSERGVINRLKIIMLQAPGRKIITAFASKLYPSLLKLLEELLKEKEYEGILTVGRSISKMLKAVQTAGLWKVNNSSFVKPNSDKKLLPKKLIVLCTGSQGEEKAVLSRLANQIYPDLELTKGDAIILNSSPIMDNRYALKNILNKISLIKGVEIYENNEEDLLHVSGHASQGDLEAMLSLTKPRHFMPYHGDIRMLKVHGQLAKETGVLEANIFVCQNGEIIQGKEKKNSSTEFFLTGEKINAEPDYVFNQKIIRGEWWKKYVDLRHKMFVNGVLVVIFLIKNNESFSLSNELPHIFTYGFINMEKNKMLIHNWKKKLTGLSKKDKKDSELKGEIIKKMQSIIFQDLPKSQPLIIPLVEYVE